MPSIDPKLEPKVRELLSGVVKAKDRIIYPQSKGLALIAGIGALLLISNPTMKGGKPPMPAVTFTERGLNFMSTEPGTDPDTVDGTTHERYTGDLPSSEITSLKNADGRLFVRAAIAMPTTRGVRKSNYPTGDLAAPIEREGQTFYDSFFLDPADYEGDGEDPIKTYSAVSGAANKRHKAEGKLFTSRKVDGKAYGKPGVEGVAIIRRA